MNRSRETVIYLPEIPWLVHLMNPSVDELGIAYAPCPLCESSAPLVEEMVADGAMFFCLVGLGGCGQRYWVDAVE